MRRGAAVLFILLGTLWGADGVTAHARPTVPQIASVSDRNGAWEIYTMRPGGTDLRQLTDDDAYDFTPAWSPDGTRIAFASSPGGPFGISTMRSDGTDVRQLTVNDAADLFPAWSP